MKVEDKPLDRVTEAELLEIADRADQHDCRNGDDPQMASDASKLVAEIRRYRALVLKLADGCLAQAGSRWHCFYCNGPELDGTTQHRDGCPWPVIEAEVRAIRADMSRKP